MKYKLLTTAIVSALHPNEQQAKGSVWEPKDRADVLEAEALAVAGFAESTNEAATVKTIAEKREGADDDDADVETELSELLEGNVETVNEAIDAAFDDLTAEQLESLSALEAKGKNRKGVLDHIAQYLDAE